MTERRRIPMRPTVQTQPAAAPPSTNVGRARISLRPQPQVDYTKATTIIRPGETPDPNGVDVWASHAAGKTVRRGDK